MPTLGHQNGTRAKGGTWSKSNDVRKKFVDEDVRKMPDGTFGVFADKFKTVKTKGGKTKRQPRTYDSFGQRDKELKNNLSKRKRCQRLHGSNYD